MSQFKIVYFNAKGRAEVIRMLLSAAKVDFNDERIQPADWLSLKAKLPSGQLPIVYTPEGKCLTESMAITRYVAKRLGFYSEDAENLYTIELIISLYLDIFDGMVKIHACTDPVAKAEQAKSFREDKLPTVLRQVMPLIPKPSEGFIAGPKPTLADIMLVAHHDIMKGYYEVDEKEFAKIFAHRDRVLAELPGISEYRKKRPDCP